VPLILVVDDYADTRELYCEYLTALGHRCASATDGQDAVEKAKALRPAVVVMDLAMPVLDGWSALARLRSDPRTAEAAIVILTGQEARYGEAEERAMAEGAAAYLAKPCLPRVLAETIARILARQRESEECAASSRRG
jgi:CheY-like chemotaxis protein